MANLFEPVWDEDKDGIRRARLGRQAGAEGIGASLYEIAPGAVPFPNHYHHANAELLIAISGRPTLRTPDGERDLSEGEVVAFPVGPDGAHQVLNRGDVAIRVLIVSEMNSPEAVVYPDSGKVGVLNRAPGSIGDEGDLAVWFRLADAVDYWEGEQRPAPKSEE